MRSSTTISVEEEGEQDSVRLGAFRNGLLAKSAHPGIFTPDSIVQIKHSNTTEVYLRGGFKTVPSELSHLKQTLTRLVLSYAAVPNVGIQLSPRIAKMSFSWIGITDWCRCLRACSR